MDQSGDLAVSGREGKQTKICSHISKWENIYEKGVYSEVSNIVKSSVM